MAEASRRHPARASGCHLLPAPRSNNWQFLYARECSGVAIT